MAGGRDDDSFVLIPRAPGALVWPGWRDQDGLDDLIDESLPATEEGPGLTDAALVAGGGAVVAWSVVGSPPVAATVAGTVALALGCILPVRAVWRRAVRRRRDAGTVAMRVDDAGLHRLASVYTELDALATTTVPARAAAHGALLEVATLLDGRTPRSEAERRYVEARLRAMEALVGALKEFDIVDTEGPPADLVVQAREELDALGGVGALSRLDELTTEIRARGQRP